MVRALFSSVLLAALVAVGCAPAAPEPAAGGAARGAPSLLLVVVDTLRADHLPFHGYRRMTAPRLSRLAESAVVFDNAFTVMSHTLPTHVSLLTGVHPGKHHVLANGWRYDGPYPTLAETLRARGYATGAFVSGYPLVAASGLDAGFDVYRDTGDLADASIGKIPGERTNARALAWIEEQRGPFFAFVHYYDVHPPYDTPPHPQQPFVPDAAFEALLGSRGLWELTIEQVNPTPITLDGRPLSLGLAINTYDNEILRVDGLIGELLATLERKGIADDTLVIVTSDHGEGLGQHGLYSHGLYLYEEQAHVPLVVRPPASVGHAARRVAGAVSLLDVVPTVLDLCGLAADPALDGRSLAGVLGGDETPREERWLVLQRRWFPAGTDQMPDERFDAGASLHALRGDGPLKYLRGGDGREELYDLGADPGERVDLAPVRRDDVERMSARLDALLGECTVGEPVEQTVDPDSREKLEALGYVR
jgi:arylsulfatase A-like enzyme